MNDEEFRAAGHRLVDWVADYRAGIEARPVRPRLEPGDVKARLPRAAPERAESLDAVIADLDDLIAPAATAWQHPSMFAFFPSNASLAGVLGDFLSTGIATLGLSWEASPALTELEEVVVDWMRELLGLPAAMSGSIQQTASEATLIALLVARERATGFSLDRGGLQAEPAPLVVYGSAQSHSSVEKAALLVGFGRENVREVPVDAAHAMRPDALATAVAADLAAGRRPCAVVATTGSTAVTAFDPLDGIADVCAAHDLYLHVDAAMAGSGMILPELRPLWAGVERADSVLINPHKWLGVPFDATLHYVRDAELLIRVLSTNPSYLQSAADGRAANLRDRGIALGRRFRALKIWLLLRLEGADALRTRLRRDLANARWLADQIRAAAGWELVAPVPLQTLCVRHVIDGDAAAVDAHTLAWCAEINDSGRAYLTPARLDGRWMVRVSIGTETTERAHVERLWQLMRETAER